MGVQEVLENPLECSCKLGDDFFFPQDNGSGNPHMYLQI